MKVACIFITLDRPELTVKCIRKNFYNSGLDADVFLIDNGSTADNLQLFKKEYPFFKKVHAFKKNEGVAAAINKGLKLSKDYDAVVTLANDILMPDGWLNAMVESAQRIHETGMIGIHCVEELPPMTENGVHEVYCPFGNVLITRKAIATIGGFNTDFGIYGMEDSDFAHRLHYAGGFVNYYLPGLKSEHIGHDVGDGTEYRKAKDDSLSKANKILEKAIEQYKDGKFFIKY